jgi:DNA (cytosine-5)-methyltransferase 1
MRILNLYAGIGGNRKLWEDVEVTAVEHNPEIAEIYQDFFPDDKVIIGDAHQYLLEYFGEYDFIWSSPPCPTHSRFNLIQVPKGMKPRYPEMALWQEIIFLKHWYKGKFCVENVITYYKPLIRPTESNNHFFWTNFHFTPFKNTKRFIRRQEYETRKKRVNFDLLKFNLKERFEKQILNNCVEPELGFHILNESKRNIHPELFK